MNSFIDLKLRLENIDASEEDTLAFIKQDYHHSIFKKDNWDLMLLKAMIEGKVSVEDACPLFLYYECQKHYPNCTPLNLLNEDKSINETVFEQLLEHLKMTADRTGEDTGEKKPFTRFGISRTF